jgi:magnesium-transporting ATPase (P-type)
MDSAYETAQVLAKPPRPLGLSLAIFASVMLYSILPLVQVSMVLIVQYRLLNRPLTLDLGDEHGEVTPIMAGGDYLGVDVAALVAQTLLGIAFLAISIAAWRGRPAWIRQVLLVAVLGLTALTAVVTLIPLLSQPDLRYGIDSGREIVQQALCGRLLATLIIPLYVVWYLNRGPARAFFRGYYLPEP